MGDDPVLGHINWSPDFGRKNEKPLGMPGGEHPYLYGLSAQAKITQEEANGQALQIVVAMGRVREWYTLAARNAYEQVAVKLLMKGFTVIEVTGMLQELRTAAHFEADFYGYDA